MGHVYHSETLNQGIGQDSSFDHPPAHNSHNCSYKVNKKYKSQCKLHPVPDNSPGNNSIVSFS